MQQPWRDPPQRRRSIGLVSGLGPLAGADVLRKLLEHAAIIEATAALAATHDEDYLLISSSTTRRSRLYHEELCHRSVRFCEINETDQAAIDRIVDLVMACRLDDAGAYISEFLTGCARHYDYTGLIAGCTEVPLALDNAPALPAIPVVESNRALADALVDACLQNRCRPSATTTVPSTSPRRAA